MLFRSLPQLEGLGGLLVELKPVETDAAVQIVIEKIGSTGIRDEHLSQLVERAAGNPLYLEELTASFARGGDLPDRLEKVVGAMVDELPVSKRLLLREASVLGGHIDVPLLVEVLDSTEDELHEELSALSRFLTTERSPRFHHDMFRVVAYEGLSFRRRRSLHARVGVALAHRLNNDPTADGNANVALHFHRAGRHRESWMWSTEAARQARARGAGVDALVLYRQAFDAAAHLRLDPLERAAVAEEMGDVAELVGDPEAAFEGYRRARIALGGHSADARSVRLLRKQGYTAEKAGNYSTSLRRYRRAMTEAERQPHDEGCRTEGARAAVGYGITRANQGRYAEALAVLEPFRPTPVSPLHVSASAPLLALLERIAEETEIGRAHV